eukprot:134864_1
MCQQSHDESIDIKDYAKTNSTIVNGIPDNAIVNENENEEMNRNNRNAYHCSDYSNYPNEDNACCYTQRRSTTRKYKLTTRRYMHQQKEKTKKRKRLKKEETVAEDQPKKKRKLNNNSYHNNRNNVQRMNTSSLNESISMYVNHQLTPKPMQIRKMEENRKRYNNNNNNHKQRTDVNSLHNQLIFVKESLNTSTKTKRRLCDSDTNNNTNNASTPLHNIRNNKEDVDSEDEPILPPQTKKMECDDKTDTSPKKSKRRLRSNATQTT